MRRLPDEIEVAALFQATNPQRRGSRRVVASAEGRRMRLLFRQAVFFGFCFAADLPNQFELKVGGISHFVDDSLDMGVRGTRQIRDLSHLEFKLTCARRRRQLQARLVSPVAVMSHPELTFIQIENRKLFSELFGHDRVVRPRLISHFDRQRFRLVPNRPGTLQGLEGIERKIWIRDGPWTQRQRQNKKKRDPHTRQLRIQRFHEPGLRDFENWIMFQNSRPERSELSFSARPQLASPSIRVPSPLARALLNPFETLQIEDLVHDAGIWLKQST